jgi:hypothetical protein
MKLLVWLVVVCSLFLTACKNEGGRFEVSSVSNGAGINAQVFRIESGATASDQYEVWLNDNQGAMTKKKVLLADKVEALQLTWISNNKLMICYGKAQIHEFSNYMVSLKADGSVLHDIQVDISRGVNHCASSPSSAT